LFSPDLMYYLDYDKSTNEFLIIRTIDQTIYKRVPRGLMNPEKEDAVKIASKFKWLDSSKLTIINNEGMEKVVDINNNFEELAYS
jgi:hypothetical protein